MKWVPRTTEDGYSACEECGGKSDAKGKNPVALYIAINRWLCDRCWEKSEALWELP